MNPAEVALVGHLAWEIPSLRPVLADAMGADDAEVLPHVIFASYVPWLDQAMRDDPASAQRFVELLDLAFADEEVRDLLAVSFLEILPLSSGEEIEELLGPRLGAELQRLRDWTPTEP
jgi:hypothetical protein